MSINLLLGLILLGGAFVAAVFCAAAKRLDQPALVQWGKGTFFLTLLSIPVFAGWALWAAISTPFTAAAILECAVGFACSWGFVWIGWIIVKSEVPKKKG